MNLISKESAVKDWNWALAKYIEDEKSREGSCMLRFTRSLMAASLACTQMHKPPKSTFAQTFCLFAPAKYERERDVKAFIRLGFQKFFVERIDNNSGLFLAAERKEIWRGSWNWSKCKKLEPAEFFLDAECRRCRRRPYFRFPSSRSSSSKF